MNVSNLSPDALDRLEAKLLADLEVVRRTRALMREHGISSGVPAAGPAIPASVAAPPPVAPGAPVPAAPPVQPRKPYDEILLDCLAQMPDTFVPQDFRRAVYKATQNHPRSEEAKVFLNRMIRQGKVAVAEARTGRNGSLYRRLVPRAAPVEPSAPASPASDPAALPPPPAEKAAG